MGKQYLARQGNGTVQQWHQQMRSLSILSVFTSALLLTKVRRITHRNLEQIGDSGECESSNLPHADMAELRSITRGLRWPASPCHALIRRYSTTTDRSPHALFRWKSGPSEVHGDQSPTALGRFWGGEHRAKLRAEATGARGRMHGHGIGD